MQIEGYKRGFWAQVLVHLPHSFSNLCLKLFMIGYVLAFILLEGTEFGFYEFLRKQLETSTESDMHKTRRLPSDLSLHACGWSFGWTWAHRQSQWIIAHDVKAAINTGDDRLSKMFQQNVWILIMYMFHTQSDPTVWLIWRGQNSDNSGKQNNFNLFSLNVKWKRKKKNSRHK